MGIEFHKEGHIAMVALNVVKTKNALSPAMLMELCNIWDECQNDDAVRVVVLYSALQDMFCAGMDIQESIPLLMGSKPISNEMEEYLFSEKGNFKGFSKAMLKEKDLEKPVIAAVHGWCITGGFEMAMGCELRIASYDARFQMRETKLGIMPMSGSNVFLPMQVGNTRALEILLTGGVFPAQTLLEWGFLNRVVLREKLMDEALSLAEMIAGNGPKSIRGMVKLHHKVKGISLKEAFAREIEIGLPVFRSDDVVEGIKAQKEKRKPDFK